MTVLMGETSPVGVASQHVPAPLAFLRGMLCLSASYRPVGHCAQLPADGWAQHPYANARGPFGDPPADDVTINTLGRLVTALDRAAAAGAVRRGLPVYVTEFGVQSKPNPYVGVSACDAGRVRRDRRADRLEQPARRVVLPVPAARRPSRARPRRRLAVGPGDLQGEGEARIRRLPPAVDRHAHAPRASTSGASCGRTTTPLKRDAVGATGPTGPTGADAAPAGRPRQAACSSSTPRTAGAAGTRSAGCASARAEPGAASGQFAGHRLWRVQWTSPGGQTFTGAATRAYTSSGRLAY